MFEPRPDAVAADETALTTIAPPAAHDDLATEAQPGTADMVTQFFGPSSPIATVLHAVRDAEIIAQGEKVGYCFQIISGCVRTVRLLEDGRRHVGEFLFAGDVFGWESTDEHAFSVEAVTPVTLRRFPISAIEARADNDPAFARELRRYISGQVRCTRGRLVLLGRKTASERVASFLVEMRERLQPEQAGVVRLPMSRGDIADHLGLTVETVCRGLTEFRKRGVIAVDRARIVIRDAQSLEMAGSDRMH
jgi:CRP/FNR family nitrogen fixation transcriptional regulator